LNTDIESAPETLVNQSGRTDQSVAPVKKKAVGAKPKAARTAKTKKAPQRPLRSSRAGFKTEKLVCRYCGSDDLAPSFKKRSDARCRACFKKRYGSTSRDKETARAGKTKAAK
jgi:PP-loop superfamily ATP-utilizing enzyme